MRVPASYCGLYSLRPGARRRPRSGRAGARPRPARRGCPRRGGGP
ncbi:hypothetical protein [Streptomyces lunaelactis]|nr:hypothetical protein [Streptomyces lunaelactis]